MPSSVNSSTRPQSTHTMWSWCVAFVQLEYRRAALEVMARDEARALELRQDAVHGREADVLVRLDQAPIDVLGAHVTRLAPGQDVQDLDDAAS